MLDSQPNQSQSQWSWIFGAVKRFTEPCYSSLTDSWPVRHVFYNLCYETWSRTCIKCFDSRVTNVVFFWNQLNNWVCFNLQKSPPWKPKSPPNLVNHKIALTTHGTAPWGAISPTLKTTDLHCLFLILECSAQSIVLKWTIFKIFKNFQGHPKKFKDNKMFFKNHGHSAFWEQIQGQSLAFKEVWQPYPRPGAQPGFF